MMKFYPECFVIDDKMTDEEIIEGLKTHKAYLDIREDYSKPLPTENKTEKENKAGSRFVPQEIGEIKI